MLNTIMKFDKERVHFELVEARRLWGTKGTDLNALMKSLTFLYLNCPDECMVSVLAHMKELEMRSIMMLTRPQ